MRRDVVALILVLCTIGVVVWGGKRLGEVKPSDVDFSFSMEGATPYSISFHADPREVWYNARSAGGNTTGKMTLAEYRAFLVGFTQAGGHLGDVTLGLDPTQWTAQQGEPHVVATPYMQPPIVPAPTSEDVERAVAAPKPVIQATATYQRTPPYEEPQAKRAVAAPRPQPVDQGKPVDNEPRTQRPNGIVDTPEDRANVAPVATSYWYSVERHGKSSQRYTIEPFSSDGRRVLAYLGSSVVFRVYNSLVPPAAMIRRFVLIAAIVLGAAPPAHAVVPGLVGPLQAMLQIGLQFGVLILASMGTMLRFPVMRRWVVAHRMALLGGFVGLALAGIGWRFATATVHGHGTVDPNAHWLTFRGGMARLGSPDGKPLSGTPKILWHYPGQTPETFAASPALVDERLYIASATLSAFKIEGAIVCLDPANGKVLWRTPTEWPVFSSPVVAGGRVYCGEGLHDNSNARLYCLDAATGETLWTVQTKSHTEGTPTVADDKVLFTAGDDGLYCVDAASGRLLWHTPDMHADTAPAVDGNRLYIGTGYGRTRTMCLELASGKVLWEKPCDLAAWAPATVIGNRVWFAEGNGDFATSNPHPHGRVICSDTQDGHELWRTELPDAILSALPVDRGHLVCGCRNGDVVALNADDGRIEWKVSCGEPVTSSVAIANGQVYVAGGDGCVHCLSLSNGAEVWKLSGVSRYSIESSPLLCGGRLYVGAVDGVLCIGP